MSGFVLDASVALGWIFERENEEEQARTDNVLERLADEAAFVPAHWHSEILNALVVGERRKIIMAAQTSDFLARLMCLNIVVDSAESWGRASDILSTARHYSLTAYDAAYLNLALAKGTPLATFDNALFDAAAKAGVKTY